MKYQATVTHSIPQIRNIKKYATRELHKIGKEITIIVDTEDEAKTINELNETFKKAYRQYRELLILTNEEL